jgi:hypothetical protein
VNDTTESIASLDPTAAPWLHGWQCRLWGCQVQRAVWTMSVVVIEINVKCLLEMVRIEDQEPVEAL